MDFLKNTYPTYSLILPSCGKELVYRPFLRKEQKILLMALKSEDPKEVARSLKQVVKNCIIECELSFEELTIYDIDYITLKLRMVSEGETLDITFQPIKDTTCPECSKERKYSIDLNQINVVKNPEHKTKFWIKENELGVIMKEPSGKMFEKIQEIFWKTPSVEADQNIIIEHIDSFFTPTNVFSTKETTKEAINEWVDTLTADQYEKLENFFKTLPKLKHVLDIRCNTCDFSEKYVIEGLSDFFI